jgi:hypothetical protein
LSGSTTHAVAFISSKVWICCTKFSCLFDVVVQKSSLAIELSFFQIFQSEVVKESVDFLPNGGFVKIIVYLFHGSFIKLSQTSIGLLSSQMPCKNIFITARRAVQATSSCPKTTSVFSFFCSSLSKFHLLSIKSCASSKNHQVPQQGSNILSFTVGFSTSTMIFIILLGVKYCPAHDFVSSHTFAKSDS